MTCYETFFYFLKSLMQDLITIFLQWCDFFDRATFPTLANFQPWIKAFIYYNMNKSREQLRRSAQKNIGLFKSRHDKNTSTISAIPKKQDYEDGEDVLSVFNNSEFSNDVNQSSVEYSHIGGGRRGRGDADIQQVIQQPDQGDSGQNEDDDEGEGDEGESGEGHEGHDSENGDMGDGNDRGGNNGGNRQFAGDMPILQSLNEKNKKSNNQFNKMNKQKSLVKKRKGKYSEDPGGSGGSGIYQSQNESEKSYKYGDFAEFAVEKEQLIQERQNMINSVLKQAMISHLQRLKHCAKAQAQLSSSSKIIEDDLKELVGKQKNIYKLIKDPANQWAKYFVSASLQKVQATKNYFEHFIATIFRIKDLRIIDGKIIDETQWNLANLNHENSGNILLQSKTNETIYVKLGSDKIGTTLFQWQGSLHTKEQLMKFDAQERKIMITMVIAFLKKKKIIVNETDINDAINQLINHAQKS